MNRLAKSETPKIVVVHSCSVKTGVLRNFAKFTGKHMRQSLFFKGTSTDI